MLVTYIIAVYSENHAEWKHWGGWGNGEYNVTASGTCSYHCALKGHSEGKKSNPKRKKEGREVMKEGSEREKDPEFQFEQVCWKKKYPIKSRFSAQTKQIFFSLMRRGFGRVHWDKLCGSPGLGARGGVVGWRRCGTVLQAGRSRDRVPMRWIFFSNLPNHFSRT
jgi:hypothetical protein